MHPLGGPGLLSPETGITTEHEWLELSHHKQHILDPAMKAEK